MTVYIGVDFHARQQTISYLTTEDGEIKRLQLDHSQPAEVRRFYQKFAGQRVVVGFESSGRAAWFEELLEEMGCDFAILEPWLRDHSTIQPWRVTENRKSQA